MIETTANAFVLGNQLRERIRHAGSITFHDWMRAVLYDPSEGYYCRSDREKWGREGDYRTSPERSSLFAATFASYFARLYEELGRPSRWTISEAGGGDGQFAGGVLQTLQRFFPQVFTATCYVIDEISPHSRSLARKRLGPFADQVKFKKLKDIEIHQGVVFSNELLDAFPVHRVKMHEGRLREFYVTVSAVGDFEWILDSLSTPRLIEYFEEAGIQLREGQVAEVNLEIAEWLEKVATSLHSGYLVSVDYGAEAPEIYGSPERHQGTLRSLYKHQMVEDVLARPGEQDLTTTVDWSFVKRAGEKLGFEVVDFDRQDKFLLSAGLLDRLEAEAQESKGEADKLRLSTAAREMILPDGMASSFQVLVQKKTA